MDEDEGPSQIAPIAPAAAPRTRAGMGLGLGLGPGLGLGLGRRMAGLKRTFCSRQGLVGDYDYGLLFRPNLPFMSRPQRPAPFFGLNERMPVLLAVLLGFQHALAMLAGIISPPLILSGPAGANLPADVQQYLVSTALIVSGLLSIIQIRRFRIYRTRYYIGTGLISVVGISFSIIPVAQRAFSHMYASGYCPSAADGTRLACSDGYGALLGTSAVCALVEILIAFIPPHILLRIFPPIVTGPTVMLIGLSLVRTGFQDWAGGSGPCASAQPSELYKLCPNVGAAHALPWGSAEFVGLGFSVFVTILLCERFGSALMKSSSVVMGLLTGCLIGGATGFLDGGGIDAAPTLSFVWTHTFRLSLHGPLVLPVAAVYVMCACEAVGDISASCDLSRLDVAGPVYESRLQGGVLADGLNGLLAALMTVTPVSTFAQNNGVIALTRCANRTAGYCCCIFLITMGILAKVAASLVAIPAPVLGGMTTFLFAAVAVSGTAIIANANANKGGRGGAALTRRDRFILTAGLALGYGATLVPTYFSHVFTYAGDDAALRALLDAVVLVMETGFAVTAFTCLVLNLGLPDEVDDDEGEDEGEGEHGPVLPSAGSLFRTGDGPDGLPSVQEAHAEPWKRGGGLKPE